MLGTESEIDIPAHVVASEEIKRAEQLAQALRSVCTELRVMRGCNEGACGDWTCISIGCAVGPALKLLESLEREARNGQTPTD